jgi:class 3 adenylate cyclase
MNRSTEDLKAKMLSAQKSGDYLNEYDLARAAIKLDPNDEFFQYCAVLALSRCNAKQRALDTFYSYKLHNSGSEYIRALEARILKDLAFLSVDESVSPMTLDPSKFYAAARTYQKEYDITGGHYSAINAATLYLLAGEEELADLLATAAIDIALKDEGPLYFSLATRAEAYLLLNREDAARAMIAEVAKYNDNNLLTRARTHHQLKLICEYRNIDPSILDPILPETVIHYCGHAFYNHQPIDDLAERELKGQIEQAISESHCTIAYGSLMAGSDILFAESILKLGGELNIWLPFGQENFCNVAVRPAGKQWVERFQACIEKANTVSYATESDFLGDESLFGYCSDVAMGMAIMRANSLGSKRLQLAVLNPNLANQSRGTISNIKKWNDLGHPTRLVPSPEISPKPPAQRSKLEYPTNRREPHAILFSDIRGYSKLSDRDILWYYNELHPLLAKVLDEFRSDIQHIDTWGDAIFLVTEKASTVAKIAVALNTVLAEIDQSKLSIKEPLMMRIGLHFGPVYKLYDHLAECYTYSSNDVTKTARIEPVTPPGEIFGTEPFVAMLELEGEGWANFEYAGTLSSAKNFGAFRMFHIRTRYQPPALLCSL